jgi:FdhD protein
MDKSEVTFSITKVAGGRVEKRNDLLAVEEPLEIRATSGTHDHREQKNISVTMRTPGEDKELALGFLFTEGIINTIDDVSHVEMGDNVIDVQLSPATKLDLNSLQRNFYTTSSCGVCGKASIEAVMNKVPRLIEKSLVIKAKALMNVQEEMIRQQKLFGNTGGIHASALVGESGSVEMIREDIGRHNALDK